MIPGTRATGGEQYRAPWLKSVSLRGSACKRGPGTQSRLRRACDAQRGFIYAGLRQEPRDVGIERFFQREATRIDRQFRFLLKSQLINGVQLFASANTYPERDDWAALNDALNPLITALTRHSGFKATCDTKVVATVRDSWSIVIRSTPKKYKPLSPLHLSAGIQIVAPYHQNEHIKISDRTGPKRAQT